LIGMRWSVAEIFLHPMHSLLLRSLTYECIIAKSKRIEDSPCRARPTKILA